MTKTPNTQLPSILVVGLPLLLIWFILALAIPEGPSTNSANHPYSPGTLEDGQSKIAYVSDEFATYDLWMIEDVNQPHRNLIWRDDEADEHEPAWSPDGMTVAFISAQPFAKSDLFTIKLDPSGQTPEQLTRTSGLEERQPAWSPDGSQLVFVTVNIQRSDLYLINSDGTNRRALLETPFLDEFHPRWSPDGTRILFAARDVVPGAKADLYTIAPSGNPESIVNLTNTHDIEEGEPRWSPDGSRILFTARESLQGKRDIWVMDADGNRQNLTPDAETSDEFNPRWSPDGAQVLFTSNRNVQFDLFVMPASGGVAQRIEIPGRARNNELEADWWGPQVETPTPGPSLTPTTTPTATPTNTPTTRPTSTPTATATPSPTSTPTPTPTPYPDLSTSTKHVNTGAALPGELLTYTITLVNSGTRTADQVRVTDPVPSEVEYTGIATATVGVPLWDSINKQITWTGSVGLEDEVIIRFQARVKSGLVEGTPILNRVNIFYSDKVHTKSALTTVGRTKTYVPLIARNRDGCLDVNLSEPNNTIGTAKGPLCPDHSYPAYIESDDDQDDLYWIWVSSAGTLEVDLTSIPPGTDYDLAVYNDQVIKIGESTEGGNADERVEASVSSEKKYYIRVHRFQGYSIIDPYELTWRLTQ